MKIALEFHVSLFDSKGTNDSVLKHLRQHDIFVFVTGASEDYQRNAVQQRCSSFPEFHLIFLMLKGIFLEHVTKIKFRFWFIPVDCFTCCFGYTTFSHFKSDLVHGSKDDNNDQVDDTTKPYKQVIHLEDWLDLNSLISALNWIDNPEVMFLRPVKANNY